MPYIDVKVSKKLPHEDTEKLKAQLGSAISLFPGKSESYLMCSITDGQTMYFQGKGGETAFVEVKLFGSVKPDAANRFTAEVCNILSEYGIPQSRTYVRYEGSEHWGYNGCNF